MTEGTSWDRMWDVFHDALERDAAERLAFLEEACGNDEELRSKVESLLGAHAASVDFLETSAIAEMALETASAPERIDAYDVVRLIAFGGMGIVYECEQEHPKRRVAVKVLRRGAMTAEARVRFQHEVEILGRLDHPGIARIYDAGFWDGGTAGDEVPYLVMEYIDGRTLVEYAEGLAVGEKLDLVASICDAVHHAHLRGVVHRDLKPANILVGANAAPRILDFGVARVTSSDLEVRTLTSDVGGLIGTIPYMSPEQLLRDARELDARSDVYAIGVILHELLTGAPPHDLSGLTIPQAIDTVRDASIASVATHDRTLRGDVETIVARALEKDREHRYQSAAEVAADLRRHLTGLPIQARPDSFAYRAAKFVRRNRVPVSVAALVVMALLVAGIVAAWQAGVALRERASADTRYRALRELAGDVIFSAPDMDAPVEVRAALVERALEYLDRLAMDVPDDRELILELASGYVRTGKLQGSPAGANLGDTEGALMSYDKAAELIEPLFIHGETDDLLAVHVEIQQAFGDVKAWQGEIQTAVTYMEEAVACADAVTTTTPLDLRRAGVARIKLGDVLGNPNFANAGEIERAVEVYEASLELFETAYERDREQLISVRWLGLAHERLGVMSARRGRADDEKHHFEASMRFRREYADARPDDMRAVRDLAVAYEKVGLVHEGRGDFEEAAANLGESLEIFEQLAQRDPSNMNAQRSVAISLWHVGDLQSRMGEPASAAEAYRRAADIFAAKVANDPTSTRERHMLAVSQLKLGDALGNRDFANLGDHQGALESYESAYERFKSLYDEDPTNPTRRRMLALVQERLGSVYRAMGDRDAAWAALTESRELRIALAAELPFDVQVIRDSGIAELKLAECLLDRGDRAAAEPYLHTALEILEGLAEAHPSNPQYVEDVELVRSHLAGDAGEDAVP